MNLQRSFWGIPFLLAAVIFLVLIYGVIFGRATLIVWEMKQEAAKDAQLSVIPVPLPNTTVSLEKGTTEEFFGYDFDVPWQDTKANQRGTVVVMFSKSRKEGILFFDPASESGIGNLIKESITRKSDYLSLRFGVENSQTDYDLARAALNTSPSQLSLVMPWNNEVVAANLLRMKEAYNSFRADNVYSFQIGKLRGFQYGDPVRTQRIEIDAYDSNDRKFRFVFSSDSLADDASKQAEINKILQSMHPESANP